MILTTNIFSQYYEMVYKHDGMVPGLYPETSTNKLDPDSLYKFSELDLEIMRNEIFARHGYKFNSSKWANYFGSLSWYFPNYINVDTMLNELEKENVIKIKSVEKAIRDLNSEHWGRTRIYAYEYSTVDSFVTLSDSSCKFVISFPTTWYMKNWIKPSKQIYSQITIENQRGVTILNSENRCDTPNSSIVKLRIWKYPGYENIVDWYKNSKLVSEKVVKKRIEDVKIISIDNKDILAWNPDPNTHWFLFNGILYQFWFMSNNKNLDYHVYEDVIKSFIFL